MRKYLNRLLWFFGGASLIFYLFGEGEVVLKQAGLVGLIVLQVIIFFDVLSQKRLYKIIVCIILATLQLVMFRFHSNHEIVVLPGTTLAIFFIMAFQLMINNAEKTYKFRQ